MELINELAVSDILSWDKAIDKKVKSSDDQHLATKTDPVTCGSLDDGRSH